MTDFEQKAEVFRTQALQAGKSPEEVEFYIQKKKIDAGLEGKLAKFVSSSAIPIMGGTIGAVAGLPIAQPILGGAAGAGAGYALKSTLQDLLGIQTETPKTQLKQAGGATVGGALGGAVVGAGALAAKGIGTLYQIARSRKILNELGQKQAKILSQQKPELYAGVEQNIPAEVEYRLAGQGYSPEQIKIATKNYLDSVKSLTDVTKVTPKGETRYISYPNINKIVESANKVFGEEGLRKEVVKAGGASLRDLYLRVIPEVAAIRDQMSKILALEPTKEIIKKRAIGSGIAAGAGIGAATLWNKLMRRD